MRVMFLRERFSWMGQHSGYDQICDAIAKRDHGTYWSVWREPGKRLPMGSGRVLRRIVAKSKSSPFYNIHSAAAELGLFWTSLYRRPQLVHVLFVENNLAILPKWRRRLSIKLIGTAHQPAGWWRLMHRYPDSVSALDALIVPGSREVSYFDQYLPERVYFIPHGVDTAFFRPRDVASDCPRCVFCGKWLRDIHTLQQVVDCVIDKNPEIRFEMIVPAHKRNDPSFLRLASHEQVSWHAGISDKRLRGLYQQASMLVMPLLDCTVNNAMLEAMACGIPIVSNNVGGVRDYTRDTFADLLPVGDVEGMTQAILRLADNREERKKRGAAARLFAEQYLSWDKIAAQTLSVYENVISRKK